MQIYFGTKFSDTFKSYLNDSRKSLDKKTISNLEAIKNDGLDDAELDIETSKTHVGDGYGSCLEHSPNYDTCCRINLCVGEDKKYLASAYKTVEEDRNNDDWDLFTKAYRSSFIKCLKEITPNKVKKEYTQAVGGAGNNKKIDALISDD